jgi:hypothetical protein
MNGISPQTNDHASSTPARFMRAVTARPLAAAFSVVCLSLFIFQESGKIKLDGYSIALLALAILPWSISAFGKIAHTIGQALVAANIKSFQIAGVKVEQLEKQLDEQRQMLDDLILYSMAFHIYDKLKFLALGSLQPSGFFGEYKYVKDEPFDHDLRYLRDHGYLEHFQISQLTPGENLVGKLKVTDMGQRFVKLKESRTLRLPTT